MFHGHSYNSSIGLLAAICIDHIHPMMTLTVDWLHNMIRFDRRHICLTMLIYMVYSVYNYILTFKHGKALYWICDWINKPGVASLFVVLVGLTLVAAFALWSCLTRRKLARWARRVQARESVSQPEQPHIASCEGQESSDSSVQTAEREAEEFYLLIN